MQSGIYIYIFLINIELTNDPAILLLAIYPKEFKASYQRDICVPTFTVFTIAPMWQ